MPSLRTAMQDFLANWEDDVAAEWRTLLTGIEPTFDAIDGSLSVRADEVIFPGRKGHEPPGAPHGSHVFRAMDDISPATVSVVVVGQDPYPRVSRATGRAFEQGDIFDWTSRSPGVSPSLKRIIQQAAAVRSGRSKYMMSSGGWKHVVDDIEDGRLNLPAPSPLFDHWQAQGVLFLNTGLTLTRYQPGGHPHQLKGHIPLWAPVIGALCWRLAKRDDMPVVFLSWGGKARKFLFQAGITRSTRRPPVVVGQLPRTAVIDRNHPAVPSFLSGQNIFEEANTRLTELGGATITW